jgi:mannose/fructose/sorbose-specific phosphotransferase system IIA component
MKGILLLSHGELAQGLMNSVSFFFGNDIEQLKALTLKKDDDASKFGERIKEAVEEINTGDGVVIFVDLFGGTPCNQSAYVLDEGIEIVTGLNLPLLMECLVMRTQDDFNVDELVSRGKESISNYGSLLRQKRDERRKRRTKREE